MIPLRQDGRPAGRTGCRLSVIGNGGTETHEASEPVFNWEELCKYKKLMTFNQHQLFQLWFNKTTDGPIIDEHTCMSTIFKEIFK